MIHIFIVNPYAGEKTFADDLRTKLESIKNIQYFVFNTRYEGYETELVKKIYNIFEGEELRFYCCGGSGTMRNMLQGFDDLSKAEVAFFPCGLTNDYLKIFGKDIELFRDIEELINGEIMQVDYIQSNYGVAINTFSCGLDSKIGDKLEDFRFFRYFGKGIPYLLSIFYSIFFSKPKKYEISIDEKVYKGKFAEILFSKGVAIGGNLWFSDKKNVSDGLGEICLTGDRKSLKLLPLLKALTSKNYKLLRELTTMTESKAINVKCIDDSVTLNLDGELFKNVSECNAHVVKEGLKLVVPKGVKL